MDEGLSIKEKLDAVISKLDEIESKKKFKLPWGIRIGSRGKIRKGWCIVMFVKNNGAIEFKFLPVIDNTVKVGDIYYDASADYIMRYKKYPLIIQPEWSIQPFSPKDNFKETVVEGKLSSAEKVIITAIRQDSIKPKMNINFTTLLIIAAVLGGGYFILKYFKVF